MLSKKLYLVCGLGAIIMILISTFFLSWHDRWMTLFIVPFVLMGALAYVFSPQIDWWWYQRNPPDLSEPMAAMLMKYFPFYKKLSAANKKRFRSRTQMYLEARGFYGKLGGDDDPVPHDIKTIISANAVMMTFGKKDFILDPFERVFLYLQAFPSPQFPEHIHASEIELEDNVMIFSAEHINFSFREPSKYYNIVLHEYAKAYRFVNKKYDYPVFDERIWNGFSKDVILKFMNLPDVEAYPVSVNFFFYYPEKFKEVLPDVYEKYKTIFNLDPMNGTDPVIDQKPILNVV